MKKPSKNNMYEEAKEKSLLAFAAAIDGDIDAEVCVVASLSLSEEAVTALRAACAGIGAPDPVFLQASSLDRASVFSAVEGLDPLVLVVADEGAAALLAEAYREPFVPDSFGFAFGRLYAAFSSFESDLADARLKQRDWALLKKLKQGLPENS
ncbi:hypothetical protein [Slackia piriformis]|uniref:hypothetical protein n=1 Tax=Slackia piriformis TaxID=626934 RepID=UPI0023F36C06|nr:hypothetical protein [Slackia piriformis]